MALLPLVMDPGKKMPAAAEKERNYDVNSGFMCCFAVVKVPLPVGCVKYKAQHVVLIVGIPVLKRDK